MPTRSVLDIEVNDQQFKDFQANFEKYQKLLSATPTAWAKVSKENAAVSKQFETMAAALMAQNSLTHDNAKAEKDRADQLKKSSTEWEKISRFTGVAAGNVLKIGGYLLKWGTILGGGLLGGSLFGLDKIGGGVSRERQSAMGLGLTIGQQKSFEVNFGRFVNPGAFLGGVNAAVTDVTQQGPLWSLGVNPSGSTEQVALATLKAVRELARATPINQLGTLLSSRHLDQLGFTEESLRTVRDDPSFGKQFGLYGQGAQAFNIDPKTALMWTDFNTKLSAAGEKIFKVLVGGLGPLAGPIGKLSDAFAGLLERVLKDNRLEKGITKIGDWIDNLSLSLEKPQFLKDVDQFTDDIGTIAGSFHTLADAISHPLDTAGNLAGKALTWDATKGQALRWEGLKSVGKWAWDKIAGGPKQFDLAKLARLDQTYGLPAGAIETIYGKESSFGQDPNGKSNPFGLTGDNRIGINRQDFDQAARRAGEILAREIRHYAGDALKGIAAYNIGEGGVDAAVGRYGKDWSKHVPYVASGVNITVTNKTDGNIDTAASQLSVLGPAY
jgi:hypothetical protein